MLGKLRKKLKPEPSKELSLNKNLIMEQQVPPLLYAMSSKQVIK